MKKWIVNQPDERLAAEFAQKCDIGLLALKVLTSRGISDFSQVVEYFRGNEEFEDPFLTTDMNEAVDTINHFVDSGELICIYGDYDCDGITATYVLYTYLQNIGANVMYHINERADGYGMNCDIIKNLCEKGVALIVTVDNGISCIEEAELIKELGMKLVITDHHQPGEDLPDCEAVVDPHRSDCPSLCKDFAGVGVALKLCAALDGGDYDLVIEQFADIAAIGTVGDLVPLVGENRTLVSKGLIYLKNTENLGIIEIIKQAGLNIDKLNSGTLGFQIAPRINAAGRFASPLIALETLLTEDPDEAAHLAHELMSLNEQRKQTEQDIYDEIKVYINKHPEVLDKRVLVLAGHGWHHGVIGIVSSRVLEDFGKPNVIISIDDDGSARGSARSLSGFNIHSCFTYGAYLLEKFGGHECAGGMSLQECDIPDFTRVVLEYADYIPEMPSPITQCDMRAQPADLSVENVRSLNDLQPSGVGNPQALFFLPRCRVNSIIPLSGGKYTKLDISYAANRYYALCFSKRPDELFFNEGAYIDIAATLDINEWNGRESVTIMIRDMKPAGMDTNKYFAALDAYEKLVGGKELPQSFLARLIPDRKELVFVYKYLDRYKEIKIDDLFMRINIENYNIGKIKLMMRIFCEAGLAEYTPSEQKIKLLPVSRRADLEATDTMKWLRTLIKT